MTIKKRAPVKKATPRDTQRDVTRALHLAATLNGALMALVPDHSRLHLTADELIQILRDLDARTGRRDPSKRKRA